MATFNGSLYLADQLASLSAQDHEKWSLWVSDDGSTDATRNLIETFAGKNPNKDIRLIEGPEDGPAANFFHLLCHPDLPAGPVALSDQDDIWRPDKLRKALEVLSNHEGSPTVHSAQSHHITATGSPIGASRIHNGTPSFGNALVQNRVAGHCATLNPAALDLIRAAGRVDVPFHDWWIYALVSGAGGTVIVSDEIALDYRQHDDNVLGGNLRKFAGLKRVFAVLGNQFSGWQSRNLAALEQYDALLNAAAQTTLKTWRAAPKFGVKRVNILRKLGINRDQKMATFLLSVAAFFGRV